MTNYQQAYDNFEWPRPAKYNFVSEVIDVWANDRSKQAILWVDDTGDSVSRTYHDLSVASKKICNVLAASGVGRGDTIVVILGRQIAWWEVFTASLRMGAVISPGTTQLSSKDLAYRINASKAVCIITDQENAAKLEAVEGGCGTLKSKIVVDGERDGWIDLLAEVDSASDEFEPVDTAADEDALCYFTSGTTGYPKMTMHTHDYAIGHRNTGKYWLNLTEKDLHWNISDTGWAKAAWSSYFGPFNCGAAVFIHDSAGFSAKDTLEMFGAYPITTMCGAPTIYRLLVLEDLDDVDFGKLRHSVGAGEPLNPEVIEVWKRATGITIRDGYGQTESTILCGNSIGVEPRLGSMGKPTPGIILKVIDEQGNILPPNTEGDIAVYINPQKPPGLFKGYKNEPEKTAKSYRGDWYLTSDRAYVDDDGYFWFVGRDDDVILSSGYRIGPFEVESALIEHDAVAESAVVSSPDEKRGEIVKAFIILTDGYEPTADLVKELQNYVKTVTAPYKYPRQIEFVKTLPKTVSGKIRRVELREAEWAMVND